MEAKNQISVDGIGGIASIEADLGSDNEKDSKPDLDQRKQKYGVNKTEQKPLAPIFKFFLDAMTDTTVIVLHIAAVISIVIGNAEASSVSASQGHPIFQSLFCTSPN
jgi:magnesium-transporting ATPase (P-type)